MTTMTHTMQVRTSSDAMASRPRQTVSIISGTAKVPAVLDATLDTYGFDVVFVESSEHAYSHIKLVRPNLIILCMGIGDADRLQVLSMLKLDDETRKIPLLTYASEYEGQGANEVAFDASDVEEIVASTRPPWPMN